MKFFFFLFLFLMADAMGSPVQEEESFSQRDQSSIQKTEFARAHDFKFHPPRRIQNYKPMIDDEGNVEFSSDAMSEMREQDESYNRFQLQFPIENREVSYPEEREEILSLINLFGQKSKQDHEQSLFFISEKEQSKKRLYKKIACGASCVVGIGAGIGITPVFMENIFEISPFDLSKSTVASNVFVYSNMGLFVADNMIRNISIALKEDKVDYLQTGMSSVKKKVFTVSKYMILGASSVIPAFYLWNVEINHREDAKTSGFDEYMTTATVLSPFLIANALWQQNFDSKDINTAYPKFSKKEKTFIYGLPMLATAARSIVLYSIMNDMFTDIGWTEPNSRETFCGLSGAIVANSFLYLLEVNNTKKLTSDYKAWRRGSKKSCSCKRVSQAIAHSALIAFSGYKTLPYIDTLIKSVGSSSIAIKSIIATPFVLSQSLMNYNLSYDSLKFLSRRSAH